MTPKSFAELRTRLMELSTSGDLNAAQVLDLVRDWRPPARVVSTAKEVDALPKGSVVLDDQGIAWQSFRFAVDDDMETTWDVWESLDNRQYQDDNHGFVTEQGPLTVVHEAGA